MTTCTACSGGALKRANACREHYNQYAREYRQKNLDRVREIHRLSRVKRYAESERERIRTRANTTVLQALKRGELTRLPCEVCGEEKTQAHHDSYKRADFLKVRFLCIEHHSETHRNMTPVYDK